MSKQLSERIIQISKKLENYDITGRDDAREFVSLVTELIYDYKMIGKIYDFYTEDAKMILQSRVYLIGPDDISKEITKFCTAFPDLKADIKKIITAEDDDGYKFFRRLNFIGTNKGTSEYGPPTGKSLGLDCLCMSYLRIRKFNGSWKIYEEITNNSEGLIRRTLIDDTPSDPADQDAVQGN